MLLAIDARNRSISVGFLENARPPAQADSFRSGRWLSVRRLGNVKGRSADEYALLLASLANEGYGRGAAMDRGVDAAWMSSVVPTLSRELGRAVAVAFGLGCSMVGPGVRTGVKIRTDVPSEVGSDLVCAAAAARELVGGPCVVVDFDAAIAFSAIGRSGDFLGAAIAPGIGTGMEALRDAAALLPEVALAVPLLPSIEGLSPAIGKSTAQSIRSGIGIGYAGLVERIVRSQREELAAMGEADSPEAVAVLGTGDEEGRALLSSLGFERFIPELVLEGIAIVASRAAPSRPVVA